MKPVKSTLSASDTALRLLAVRAYSAAELAQRLRRRGYEPSEATAAVERVKELGYIDDAAYARELVRGRLRTRGRAAIALDLRWRGVDRATAEAALGEVDEAEEVESARRLAEAMGRKLGTGEEAVTRIAGRLQQRGFARSVIRRALT